MASIAPHDLTPITIKISIEGNVRRFRLPLRDLAPSIFIYKLRSHLGIPATTRAVFERYSDTAAAFVVLDPSNASVFKQLYSAARAKLKLRIRVTIIPSTPNTTEKESTILPQDRNSRSSTTKNPADEFATFKYHKALQNLTSVCLTDNQNEFKDSPSKETRHSSRETLDNDTTVHYNNIQKLREPLISRAREFSNKSSRYSNTYPETRRSELPEKLKKNPSTDTNTSFQSGVNPNTSEDQSSAENSISSQTPSPFNIFCNNCDASVLEEHYHCSNCDDGDYDLCLNCVAKGILCPGEDHWLIKRFTQNEKLVNSTTEIIAPKIKPLLQEEQSASKLPNFLIVTRTCNSCIQEFSEENFITCTSCPDYDLCIACHVKMEHGHHPKHGFEPAVSNTRLTDPAKILLAPGRGTKHNAICDACQKSIYGVRHKCLDCPNWDYCSTCAANASSIHPSHRFVLIYDPQDISPYQISNNQAQHIGVLCDGPLCSNSTSFIDGIRYKCAVCHDTDFCSNCEASPLNTHNHTHPLIKFKTPIRDVSVTTLGEDQQGQVMPIMGDKSRQDMIESVTVCPLLSQNSETKIQTVCNLAPTEVTHVESSRTNEIKRVEHKGFKAKPQVLDLIPKNEELVASFVRDEIPDGTIMLPDTDFEQTWYLRNDGKTTWPAGCCVTHVGGTMMNAAKSSQQDIKKEVLPLTQSASYKHEVLPGTTISITVSMRTPSYPGNFVSYWRLTTPDGNKIGHRLWCDILVELPKLDVQTISDSKSDIEDSEMIFPTLEKETPDVSNELESTAQIEVEEDEYDNFVEESFGDPETDDGFLTDDDYEILDASDEAFSIEQQKTIEN